MTPQQVLDAARKAYSNRRFDTAHSLVTQLLEAKPGLAEAHNLRGVILATQGELEDAAKAFGRATRLDSLNANYYSNLGETERRRGRLRPAKAALSKSLAIKPDHVQSLNNLGIIEYDSGNFEGAAHFYRQAIDLIPDYPEAHNNLGNALRALGDLAKAVRHYQAAIALRKQYPEAHNNLAAVFREQGLFAQAEYHYRQALAQQENYVDCYINLALLLESTARSDEGLQCLEKALLIDPHHSRALVQTGRICLKRRDYERAQQAASRILAANADSIDALAILGQALHEEDHLEDAARAYQKALRLCPTRADILSSYGVTLKALGRFHDANEQFDKALQVNPQAYGAYVNLSDLQKFTRENPHFMNMERIWHEASDQQSDVYMPLHFALGKAYEDLGDFEKAFFHFERGAKLKRAVLDYDEVRIFGFFDAIMSEFTAGVLKNPPYAGSDSDAPVFIIGMPRSGSTLLEQILSGHPLVYGAGETKEFPRQVNSLRRGFPNLPGYPHFMQNLAARDYERLAGGYLSRLRKLSSPVLRITDKLLTNYFYVGLLHILFPKAKFLHARRNAVDTCMSSFTKLFSEDMPHSYDLAELGRYYRKYDQLMHHWESLLPKGTMKSVAYESIVADLPTTAREVVAFVGLPWSDECLSFHRVERPIKTASAVQVREPLYSTSVGRSKHYGEKLKPLLDALRGEA